LKVLNDRVTALGLIEQTFNPVAKQELIKARDQYLENWFEVCDLLEMFRFKFKTAKGSRSKLKKEYAKACEDLGLKVFSRYRSPDVESFINKGEISLDLESAYILFRYAESNAEVFSPDDVLYFKGVVWLSLFYKTNLIISLMETEEYKDTGLFNNFNLKFTVRGKQYVSRSVFADIQALKIFPYLIQSDINPTVLWQKPLLEEAILISTLEDLPLKTVFETITADEDGFLLPFLTREEESNLLNYILSARGWGILNHFLPNFIGYFKKEFIETSDDILSWDSSVFYLKRFIPAMSNFQNLFNDVLARVLVSNGFSEDDVKLIWLNNKGLGYSIKNSSILNYEGEELKNIFAKTSVISGSNLRHNITSNLSSDIYRDYSLFI
jgi:hypothetical protein